MTQGPEIKNIRLRSDANFEIRLYPNVVGDANFEIRLYPNFLGISDWRQKVLSGYNRILLFSVVVII